MPNLDPPMVLTHITKDNARWFGACENGINDLLVRLNLTHLTAISVTDLLQYSLSPTEHSYLKYMTGYKNSSYPNEKYHQACTHNIANGYGDGWGYGDTLEKSEGDGTGNVDIESTSPGHGYGRTDECSYGKGEFITPPIQP